ncbi:hypothetical protein [Natrinema gari]|uniref:Uncharacterized protein n=1 Tax=Natrinema gari JCM 14663 TaxID=1230459 RepID=L9Z140_9EURY|nr:hypothetical protein [Natrinema gari]ELY79616.1 hypothetical protein C486_11464 [Natrinema gari JCM 14663]
MSDADVDSETAESLARARLAEALRHPGESTGSDIARLAELADAITTALDRGERPEKRTVEEARFRADRIETRLDEVTALFGWHPRDAGANWGVPARRPTGRDRGPRLG